MATKRFEPETLDQAVREGLSVEVKCKRCWRTIVVDALPLLRWATLRCEDRALARFGKHMKCRDCRARFPQLMLTDAKPDSPPVGIVNEAQWERMKKRLRQ